MIILGIDTSTSLLSVGLSSPEGCLGETRILRGARHAEMLTRVIEDLLETTGIGLDGLAGIAVAIGPGSFTGLRIGLGTAKGLAFGQDLPLVGIPSMEGYLSAVPGTSERACVLVPSRKGEYYVGLYHRGGGGVWSEHRPLVRVETVHLGPHLPEGSCVYLGQGAWECRSVISAHGEALIWPPPLGLASGYGVAEAARPRLNQGEGDDADALIPVYHQAFQGVN